MRSALEGGSVNPMELKKKLAADLVTQFHDVKSAISAGQHFEQTVQRSQVPDEIPEFSLPGREKLQGKRLSNLLVDAGVASSASEARRLIDQGAVQLNGVVVKANDSAEALGLKAEDVIRAGRRRYVKLVP